jgi:adenylate cyclase, class 2
MRAYAGDFGAVKLERPSGYRQRDEPGEGQFMRNLEAKFSLPDLTEARNRAEGIGFVFSGLLIQRDTFFVVSSGKLKLREQDANAWLIHYRRDHSRQLELSNYDIVAVSEADATRAMLTAALGKHAEVRKERTLLTRRNIRLHLDRVDGLGDFGEIEAILPEDRHAEDYRAEVDQILEALGVKESDLIGVSYFELMQSARGTSA